jgi:lysozyme
MSNLHLSAADARDIVKQSGEIIREPLYILAIRGYNSDMKGDPGNNDRVIYNDSIFLIGTRLYLPVHANTDPSRYKPGIATLTPGLHYYKKGLHLLNDPDSKKKYPAFRPATPDESLPVTRHGEKGTSKGYAINIHKGSLCSMSGEGCQTVSPDQWKEFQRLAYNTMDKYWQTRIGYLLIVTSSHFSSHAKV